MNSSEHTVEITPAGQLRVAGVLDAYAAAQLRDELDRAVKEQAQLTVDLSAVESCDFTALQLFCSARRSAERAGKRFVVTALPEAVVQSCAAMGLSPQAFSAEGSE